jgi:hypothetical protein
MHDIAHCWQARGGMEGQKPEWMVLRDKARVEMHIQPAHAKLTPTALSQLPLPAAATTQISAAATAGDDLGGSGLLTHFEGDLSCTSIDSGNFDVAFLVEHFLSVLMDSGTTSHLIINRSFFWSFDSLGATSVRTANHRVLATTGRGDCLAVVRWGMKRIQLKLRGCLHAPSAVINLFSVGRMVAANLRMRFEDGWIQMLLPNCTKFYERPLERMLGFVDVEFIPPLRTLSANRWSNTRISPGYPRM